MSDTQPQRSPGRSSQDAAAGLLDPWRDYLSRSVAENAWSPEQLALVDATERWLARQPDLYTAGQVAMSLEASATFYADRLETRRYIVGVPLAALPRRPWGALRSWLELCGVPPEAQSLLQPFDEQSEVPTAVHVGQAWSDNAERRAGRLYVERRPLQSLLDGAPGQAMHGVEWSAVGGLTARRYIERQPVFSLEGGGEAAASLLRRAVAPRLQYMWDREDPGGSDRYWHLHPTPVADGLAWLPELTELLLGQGARVQAWLGGLAQGAQLRVIGWGTQRNGAPRLKIYHAPPPLAGRPAPPNPSDVLRRIPGAVGIELQRSERPGWLVWLPPGQDPGPKPARHFHKWGAYNIGAAQREDLDAVLALLAASEPSACAALAAAWPEVQACPAARGVHALRLTVQAG